MNILRMFFKQNFNVSEPEVFAVRESRETRNECIRRCSSIPRPGLFLACKYNCPSSRELEDTTDEVALVTGSYESKKICWKANYIFSNFKACLYAPIILKTKADCFFSKYFNNESFLRSNQNLLRPLNKCTFFNVFFLERNKLIFF
jgi:hypothetical protein